MNEVSSSAAENIHHACYRVWIIRGEFFSGRTHINFQKPLVLKDQSIMKWPDFEFKTRLLLCQLPYSIVPTILYRNVYIVIFNRQLHLILI